MSEEECQHDIIHVRAFRTPLDVAFAGLLQLVLGFSVFLRIAWRTGSTSVTVFETDLSRRYKTCILTSSSSLYLRASLAYFSARSGSAARLRLLSLG